MTIKCSVACFGSDARVSLLVAACLFLTFGYSIASGQATVEQIGVSSGDSISVTKDDEVNVPTVLRLTAPAERLDSNGTALDL